MFQWDSENISHIAEHGITPEEAEQVIVNDPFDFDIQYRKNEERIVQLGETAKGRILVVVTTWRDNLIRVITAFPASKALRTFYISQKGAITNGEGIQNP
jgi:uncharacterized protein